MKRVFIFLLSILLLAAGNLPAQQETRPVVRQIEIQYAGAPSVSRERILANMRTKVGEPYSDQVIEEDIRSLYPIVENVRIFGEPVENGVKVVVVVQTKATVASVAIQGATRFKESRLRPRIDGEGGRAAE